MAKRPLRLLAAFTGGALNSINIQCRNVQLFHGGVLMTTLPGWAGMRAALRDT